MSSFLVSLVHLPPLLPLFILSYDVTLLADEHIQITASHFPFKCEEENFMVVRRDSTYLYVSQSLLSLSSDLDATQSAVIMISPRKQNFKMYSKDYGPQSRLLRLC